MAVCLHVSVCDIYIYVCMYVCMCLCVSMPSSVSIQGRRLWECAFRPRPEDTF